MNSFQFYVNIKDGYFNDCKLITMQSIIMGQQQQQQQN
jgi:hypothetical protein